MNDAQRSRQHLDLERRKVEALESIERHLEYLVTYYSTPTRYMVDGQQVTRISPPAPEPPEPADEQRPGDGETYPDLSDEDRRLAWYEQHGGVST